MDDQSLTPQASVPPAGTSRSRVLWPLAALAIVAILGAGAGAYFGLRGAKGPGSGLMVSPPARAFAAAAYDEASHQVVLFGGMGADGTALGDTWTWDGSTWTQQHPQTPPPARAYAVMAYDPKAHDVVLVGGRSTPKMVPPTVCSGSITAGGPNATPGTVRPPTTPCAAIAAPTQFLDTWLWDGANWRLAAQAPAQMPGLTPVVGTDPTTGQVLMLTMSVPTTPQLMCPAPLPSKPGGAPIAEPACPTVPEPKVLTWSWSGTSWTELPSVSPPAIASVPFFGTGALASDPISGHLIDVRPGNAVACAANASAAAALAVPCPLYTSSPVPASPGAPTSPSASGSASGPLPAIATAPSKGTPQPVPSQGATAPVPPSAQPGGPAQPAPVPVPCCYGGSLTTWTGSAWKDATNFTSGPGVFGSMLAGDPAQHQLVAYTSLGTWTWNGSAWKQQHPAASPTSVQGATLVYDGVSGKLLLFGGEAASSSRSSSPTSQTPAIPVSDELWAWDGSTWNQLSAPKGSPAPSPATTPTPTFVPPATPQGSPVPSGRPSPSPSAMPCIATPLPTLAPGKPTGTSTGPNVGCAVPSATAVSPG